MLLGLLMRARSAFFYLVEIPWIHQVSVDFPAKSGAAIIYGKNLHFK
jgi:hypothetical protein